MRSGYEMIRGIMLVILSLFVLVLCIIVVYAAKNKKYTWSLDRFPLSVSVDQADLDMHADPQEHDKITSMVAVVLRVINHNMQVRFFDEQVSRGTTSDITIHMKSNFLDGVGKILAIAYYPPVGKVYFDMDDQPTSVGLRLVLLHELGHILGLDDNDFPESMMYRYFGPRYQYTRDDASRLSILYPHLPIKYKPITENLFEQLMAEKFNFKPAYQKPIHDIVEERLLNIMKQQMEKNHNKRKNG